MLDSRAKELKNIGTGLFTQKAPWDSLCQDIAENFYPMRSDFTSTLALGDDFSCDLMESYPVQVRETLGNTPNAMLRQGEWFEIKTGIQKIDEDSEVARWLEHATTEYRRLVYDRRANFTAATIEVDHDYVSFGLGVMSVEESPTRDHMLFRAWHPKDAAWMLNDVGAVDHLQRKMKKTARNIKKRWPNCHADIIRACEKSPNQEFNIRHIVMPTDEIYGDDKAMRRKYKGKPFLSLYIDCDHETILGEGGLPVFNYIVPRWRTLSNIPQAFSPAAINSLPDGRMIQAMARIILEQGEKAIDPPMIGSGEVFRSDFNVYAGGMTYADLEADQKLQDVFNTIKGGDISIGLEMKKDTRELLAEAWLINKLYLPDTREMTAYETQERMAGFRRAVLPFFGPVESQYNLPMLDAGFQQAIINKQFDLTGMPEILADREVTFTFQTPLNTAEGRADVSAFQESVQIIAGAAQMDKSIVADYDFKKMTKDAVKGTGAKADWVKDETEAQPQKDETNQVDQLTQAAAALREGAGVATDVAGASVALQQAGMA
jgi:hypothetical protein